MKINWKKLLTYGAGMAGIIAAYYALRSYHAQTEADNSTTNASYAQPTYILSNAYDPSTVVGTGNSNMPSAFQIPDFDAQDNDTTVTWPYYGEVKPFTYPDSPITFTLPVINPSSLAPQKASKIDTSNNAISSVNPQAL